VFGGHGVYHADLMFALVADDELFLKVDDYSIGQFEVLELSAFEFHRNGKTFNMSYHQAPEEIYDAPERAQYWAEVAYAAALRSAKPSKNKDSNTKE